MSNVSEQRMWKQAMQKAYDEVSNSTALLWLTVVTVQGGDLLDWTNRDGGIQEESFIQRIEALSTMGYSVLLSNYRRYFSLASYLSTFSKESIVISMGIPSVRVSQLLPSKQSWMVRCELQAHTCTSSPMVVICWQLGFL